MKVVIRKPKGVQVIFGKNYMLDIVNIYLGNVEMYFGLVPQALDNDATPFDPKLDEIVVLSSDELIVVMNTNMDEPSYEYENEFGIEEDENVIINK